MGEQSLEHELQILESILFPTCCILIQTKTEKDKEHKTSKSLTKKHNKSLRPSSKPDLWHIFAAQYQF